MFEYFTSLSNAQCPGPLRSAGSGSSVRLHALLERFTLKSPVSSRAMTGLLLLAAVACTSPYPAQRSASGEEAPPTRVQEAQGNDIARAQITGPAISTGLAGVAGYPAQIALILPLSGRQQAAGIAVRDGFLAALLQQDPARRPVVNIYDSATLSASAAYARAVSEGAQFVVGPLIKEDVQTLAESGAVSLPTLALNYLPENALPPGLLYQFALDPEDEARQVARRAIADGRTHGVALLPNNEWGQRLLRAFEAEFSVAGGSLVGRTLYDPAARDYSQPIMRLLLIDQSRARANALATALGSRFEFEPRARGDVQFVFIGAQPLQGRSLRPALRFHLSQDLPVYATSDVFEPDSNGNIDLDGVIFPDMPWVIAPDAAANNLRGALSAYWPGKSRGRGRLYAFGFDAFQLIPVLRSSRSATALSGMTGRLLVDDRGRVRRELDWAQVENGRPRPLPVIATGMSGP